MQAAAVRKVARATEREVIARQGGRRGWRHDGRRIRRRTQWCRRTARLRRCFVLLIAAVALADIAHVAHAQPEWRMPRSIALNFEPLRLRFLQRDRNPREIHHHQSLVVVQGLIDMKAVRLAGVAAMNDDHRSAKRLRRFHEAALQFEKAVAYRVRARKAQPCKTIALFIACEIRIALHEHDERAHARTSRRFRRMFEPERGRHRAILELAVAPAGRQVVIVRARRIESDERDAIRLPTHDLAE